MKASGKKALSLLLALLMIVSLMSGAITIGAAVEGDAAAPAGSLYLLSDNLTPGVESLIVAQFGSSYYALNYDGSLGAVEVNVTDGSVYAEDTAAWIQDENEHLASKYDPSQYIFAGSGGRFQTYDDSFLRTFSYDPEQQIVLLHDGKYWLSFDGNNFGNTETREDAATILIFEKFPGFVSSNALTVGYEYVIATEYEGSYYAMYFVEDGHSPDAIEITVNDGLVTDVGDDTVWIPDEDDCLHNKEFGVFIYPSSTYGLATYDGSGRTFVYLSESKHIFMHKKYYMTFDGSDFAQSENEADAATMLLFARALPADETEPEPPAKYPQPDTVVKDAVKNDDGSIVLAFSSDVHYDGQHMNLATWLPLAEADVGYIDSMGFCGDMGSAYASNADDFWTWTGAVMDYMDSEIEAGNVGSAVYTHGNHEWFPTAGGDFENEYANYPAATRLMQVGEAVRTDDYIIYCFGAGEIAKTFKYDYNEFDIAEMAAWLETAPTDIPIFVLTHFPIHYWYGRGEERYMKHANEVIDMLNTHSNLVVLWGHNHSDYDDNYYAPCFPGDEIRINPEGDTRTLNFTYLAAGCTADAEYSSATAGSAATLPKGLVATIEEDGSINYVYYTIDGQKMNIESPWMVRFREGVVRDGETALKFIDTQYVNDGETVKAVEAPEIDGYEFTGWTMWDHGSEEEFDFATPITRNLLVTANYEDITLPVAEEIGLEEDFVYVTIQDEQDTAVGTSGTPIAVYPIPYTEGMTIGDAFVKVHELEFEGGTDGVTVEDSGYGGWYLTKVWGHTPEHGSWIFDRDSSTCWIDGNAEAVPGTVYYALAYDSAWLSTSFLDPARTETEVGETITMAAKTFSMDSSYNYAAKGVDGDVWVGTSLEDLADSGVDAAKGYFDISFDEPGEYIVAVKSDVGEAMGFVTVNAAEPKVKSYVETGELKADVASLIVAEYEDKYYALTYDGSLGAVEVEIGEDGTIQAEDVAAWVPDGSDHLASKYNPEQYIFGSSGGLTTWDSSMLRTFVYDAEKKTVTVHKYWLSFDGTKFGQADSQEGAAVIRIFSQFDGFIRTDSLTAGNEFVIVTEKDGVNYALTYDGSLGAVEVTVDGDYVTDAPDAAVWVPDGADHLASKYDPEQYIFGSSGGLTTWDSSMLRTFIYDAETKTVTVHKYWLSFDGTKFGQADNQEGAAVIDLFGRKPAEAEEPEEPEEPVEYPEPETVRRSAVKNADGSITLAFTSDVHYDGKTLNLKTWLDNADVGYIDAVGFCGDMGSAYASNAEDFWTWTGGIMDYMDSEIEAGNVGDAIYTLGNHEWFPSAGGNYSKEYANYPAAQRLMQVGEGLVTDDYIIYCFGAGRCVAESYTNDYMEEDIAELDAWLATAPTDVPIFMLTHFPLHFWYNNRYAPHAVDVIDVLNKYADDHEIIFFWGHNHSDFDDGYYKPRFPGDEIVVDPDGNTRTLNFTYLAAGCTSDADYTGPTGGSASVMNKGLVVTIGADGGLAYKYYTLDGLEMNVESPWLVRFREGVEHDGETALRTLSTQYVVDGQTVTAVEAPENEGYTFAGWYYWDDYAEVEFDFSAPITRNYLVTANYERIIKPVAEEVELDPNYVYVTIEDEQATAVGTSGKPIALYPIPYTEGMTIGDAFVKVHELEFEGGTDGVTVEDSGYGGWYLTKVWGHTPEHGSWIFDRASSTCWVDGNAAAVPGTVYYTLAYDSAWLSTSFMNPAKTETFVGETITMAGMTFSMDSSYKYAAEGFDGDVWVGTSLEDLADSGIDAKEGYFDISFDEVGEYIVVVKGKVGDAMGFVTVKEYTWGDPEWTWADDYSSATALFTAVENEELTEEVEAEVTSRFVGATDEEDAKTVYTATVEFNGETYTDEQEVPIPDDEDVTEPADDDEPADEPAEEADDEPEDQPRIPFTDVAESDWYYEDVCAVYEAGLVNGMDETTFSPTTNVSRAQFVTILFRLAKEPAGASLTFKDVDRNAWYAPAAAWSGSEGIVKGMSKDEFAPDLDITREQFVTILYRYALHIGLTDGPKGDLSAYPDGDSVSDWAKDAMIWACENGIIQGDKNGVLDPQGKANRAQMAAIFHRFLNLIG